jgi:quercetin dioxygenase-like cupin family protein
MKNQALRWEDIPAEKMNENITRQVIWGENGTLARLTFAKGTHTSPHKHEAEQHTCIVNGTLEFRIGDERLVLKSNDMLVVPSWVEHEAWALEDTTVIDFFAPRREDWLRGEDSYDLPTGPS